MKFAITYFSPVHPEMEICRRIERASQNLGIECYFVGQDGYVLQNKKHITEIKPDFLIVFDPAHLTLFDVFTYHLLWFVPGLVNTQHAIFYNALSINCDDRLGFPSEKAISYYNQFYGDINLNYLFPSVPKNYVLPPREFKSGETYKAFYAGINVDSKTVRHEKIFKYLDEKGLVNLYGPRQIEGKTNWKGFKAYRGEIKFDGHSLMETANASGITLALHHEVHASFSMPTNRLFEGIAAGTLVITDRMSFAEKEFKDCIALAQYCLQVLGVEEDVTYHLSKWDPNNREKYIGDPEVWNETEEDIRQMLEELNIPFTEDVGEAAFYGPKVDINAKNVYGKEDTMITIQWDALLAEQFDMYYIDEKGDKVRPYIIHRTSMGCYERTLAWLIEKYAGMFPTWLCPEQVRVLPISDKYADYADSVAAKIREHKIYVEADHRAEKLGYKIRDARLARVPYILVVGEKEQETGAVSVRSRFLGDEGQKPLEQFINDICEEIRTKAIRKIEVTE